MKNCFNKHNCYLSIALVLKIGLVYCGFGLGLDFSLELCDLVYITVDIL